VEENRWRWRWRWRWRDRVFHVKRHRRTNRRSTIDDQRLVIDER
jgi:hypothetical protein